MKNQKNPQTIFVFLYRFSHFQLKLLDSLLFIYLFYFPYARVFPTKRKKNPKKVPILLTRNFPLFLLTFLMFLCCGWRWWTVRSGMDIQLFLLDEVRGKSWKNTKKEISSRVTLATPSSFSLGRIKGKENYSRKIEGTIKKIRKKKEQRRRKRHDTKYKIFFYMESFKLILSSVSVRI